MSYYGQKNYYIGIAFLNSEKYRKRYRPGLKEKIEDFFVGLIKKLELCHVEIANYYTGQAYSSTKDRGVRREPREFSSEDYEWWKIEVSKAQFDKVFEYLESKIGCPYNFLGFYINFILPSFINPYDSKEKAFMCTELVCRSLLYGGVLQPKNVNPLTCDTDQLYSILKPKLILVSKPKIKTVDSSSSDPSATTTTTIAMDRIEHERLESMGESLMDRMDYSYEDNIANALKRNGRDEDDDEDEQDSLEYRTTSKKKKNGYHLIEQTDEPSSNKRGKKRKGKKSISNSNDDTFEMQIIEIS